MKPRILFFVRYLLFWYLFFALNHLVFLTFHYSVSYQFPLSDWFRTIWYGRKLDYSTTAYLVVLPSILITIMSFFRSRGLYKLMNIYTALSLGVVCLLVVIDLEIYKHWGFRLDRTPLDYMGTPKEALFSVNIWTSLKQIFIGVIIFTAFWLVYKRFIASLLKIEIEITKKLPITFLGITLLLIIPMRGGVGKIPLSVSSSYFHTNMFMNHSSINVIWNVVYSFSEGEFILAPINFYDEKKAEQWSNDLYKDKGLTTNMLRVKKPNVVIILLESFDARTIEALGGKKGVTPNFNRLIKEGIFFSNFYSAGDRSNRAIVSVLTGYPAQRNTSIIYFPAKSKNLPYLSKELKKNDYQNWFYYGGDMNFSNFNIFFRDGEFEHLITSKNFSKKQSSEWGAADEFVFQRFIETTQQNQAPFFKMLFTLSSHTPYDVPMPTVFKGNDEESKYFNSIYYTDKCLGDFIEKAKKSDWWNSTVVILMADHGIIINGKPNFYDAKRFNIPMLWLGGALAVRDTIVKTYADQTDIPSTVLHQLKIDAKPFRFSKNIFSTTPPNFAFFLARDMYGFMSDSAKIVYNNENKHFLLRKGMTDSIKKRSQAIFQVQSVDFTEK